MYPENDKHFNTEWIERYLSGELQGEELEKFTHRLYTDAAFQQEVTVQRTIVEQAQQVGREELHRQLKTLHRQLGFNKEKNKRMPMYAMAAVIILLLVATFVFYFAYKPTRNQPAISQVNKPAVSKQPLLIRLKITGQQPNMGFSGTHTDSTTTILIYPAVASSPTYQFDDTLRLYGTFTPSQLILQYDQAKEQYTLLLQSIAYPLERYRPRQVLPATP